MKRLIFQKKLIKEYNKGFEDGKKSSLKHNIVLLKLQLKAQKEYKKEKLK